MSVFFSLIVLDWYDDTIGYLLLAGLGVGLGVVAALTEQRASRWGVGLGVALSVVCGGVLWAQFWPGSWPGFLFRSLFVPRLVFTLGSVVLAHICLWLGADRTAPAPGSILDRRQRRARGEPAGAAAESSPTPVSRWRSRLTALWALVALQAVVITMHWGATRLPCSWLDPVRVAAGCQGAITSFAGDERLEALSSTSQGVLAITRDHETMWVRRLDDGALVTTIALPPLSGLVEAAVSSDSSLVLLQSAPRQINVWRVADGARLQPVSDALTISEGAFWEFAVAPDGMTVATNATFEDGVRLWRVSDGQLLRTIPAEHVSTMVFSPDGSLLAVRDTDELHLWRVADGILLRTLDLKLLTNNTLRFSPDGQLLAVGGKLYDPNRSGPVEGMREVVQVWRVADGVLLHSLSSGIEATDAFVLVMGAAFTPDGTSIAVSFAGAPLQLWRISDGALLRSIRQRVGTQWLAFSDNGQTLLIEGRNGMYRWATR